MFHMHSRIRINNSYVVGLCRGLGNLGRKYSKIAEKSAWAVKYDATDGGFVGAPNFG